MTKRRVVIISQARMTSTRLPGKVLMEAAGRPLLAHHLDRLRRSRRADAVALATTVNATDDPVVELAGSLGVPVHRGDEDDVLSRFAGCAGVMAAEVVVRVTGDCPLIDPDLIDALLDRFLAGGADYMSIDTTIYPRGLDAEAFTRTALDRALAEAGPGGEREHVTPYIYRHPERFRLAEPLRPDDGPYPYRWCVDEPADFELIRRMLEALVPVNPGFGWQDCCTLSRSNPAWSEINRGVAQRKAV